MTYYQCKTCGKPTGLVEGTGESSCCRGEVKVAVVRQSNGPSLAPIIEEVFERHFPGLYEGRAGQ